MEDDLKKFIGSNILSLKTIAKHFGIKRRVLYRQMNSYSELEQVKNPLDHGSGKKKSRCWKIRV